MDIQKNTIDFLIVMALFLLIIIGYAVTLLAEPEEITKCQLEENYKLQNLKIVSENGLSYSWWINSSSTIYINGVEIE